MLGLVWEIVYMSTFVFGIGYGLHFIAYRKGLADEFDVVKTKKLKKDANGKKRKYKTGNAFLDKWLDFGGGYYGIVALIHLVFIELGQIREFIANWTGLGDFINSLGIGTIIAFLIEQLTNFIAAILWPTDYLGRYSILELAIFIFVTYAAYDWSRKVARIEVNKAMAN